ncbi:MAG: DMT family transporter [Bacteroidota bacterium]
MYFLLFCILSSTGIFIIFKSIDRFGIPSFPVIVINYLVAALLGFLIHPDRALLMKIHETEWLPASMIIGILFIAMFFLVAYSSRTAGISVTTVASKMSVIFPIVFSLLIDKTDRFTFMKGLAILLTLAGVTMTVFKPRAAKLNPAVTYIPLLLFVGMGVVDSLVKFAQHRFVDDNETALFSAVLFMNAFFTGILVLFFSPGHLPFFKRLAVWGWGFLLGTVNFGSIFFLVRALNYKSAAGTGIDSSVIFGVNNTGIVALSVLAGLWIFRERLEPINWTGISLSAIALILFAMG